MRQAFIADRYRLLRLIGRGGMGRVWLARDETLRRDVAIKEIVPPGWLIDSERDELRERTMREARTAARLTHPHVVRVYDVVHTGDTPWIVMEYVPSRSLQEILETDGPVGPERAAVIGLAVLAALRAAHRVGVLHRDVKPHNVLIGPDGRVVLTDFGLATIEGDGGLTRSGLVLGSPQYVAPERAAESVSTPASDLWSLGATLYAATEGRAPYARPTPMATLTALATMPPDPPRNAGPLAPLLDGLLHRDPRTRLSGVEAEQMLRRIVGPAGQPSGELDPLTDPSTVAAPQSVREAFRMLAESSGPLDRPDAGSADPVGTPHVTRHAPATDGTRPDPAGEGADTPGRADTPDGADTPGGTDTSRITGTTGAAGTRPGPPAGIGLPTRPSVPTTVLPPAPDRREPRRRTRVFVGLVVVVVTGVSTALVLSHDTDSADEPGTGAGVPAVSATWQPGRSGSPLPAGAPHRPGPSGVADDRLAPPETSTPTAGPTGPAIPPPLGPPPYACQPPPPPHQYVTRNPKLVRGLVQLLSGWTWHVDQLGFQVAVPIGWEQFQIGGLLCFHEPHGPRVLIVDTTTSLTDDASGALRALEQRLAGQLSGYAPRGISKLPRGRGAEWEGVWTDPRGIRVRTNWTLFTVTPDRSYTVIWHTPDADWPANLANLDLIQRSFDD